MKYFFCLAAVTVFYWGCKKSGTPGTNTGNTLTPNISINDVMQDRTATTSTFSFSVSLSAASTKAVTVDFTTADGQAKANVDYTPVSGTVTIPAGSTTGKVDVQVLGDSTRKDNQAFTVNITNAANGKIARAAGTGTIVNENNTYLAFDTSGYTTPDHYPGYTLAWSDEFNGNSVNTANWGFESGNNNGWGNHELENYTNRINNAFVSQGSLIIEARSQPYNGNNYTSARMITKGKQSFTLGRVDIRAKLPKGKGVWPALWMLGDNIDAVGWPACGEIDIMELLGHEPNKMYGTLHWGTSPAGHSSKGSFYVLPSGSFDQQFHVYSMQWVQDTVKLLVDDHLYLTINSQDVAPSYPFNSKFFFIFNIAVGGDWPGIPDGTTTFPQRMFVDYVRVFQ